MTEHMERPSRVKIAAMILFMLIFLALLIVSLTALLGGMIDLVGTVGAREAWGAILKTRLVVVVYMIDAIGLFVFGSLLIATDFYVVFLRAWLHEMRGGERRKLRNVSMVLVVGPMLLWSAANLFRLLGHPVMYWTSLLVGAMELVIVVVGLIFFKDP